MNIQALRYAQGDNDDLHFFRKITGTNCVIESSLTVEFRRSKTVFPL